MGAHLSQPFQHRAIDSCHTILCTKCHLSYYKFSAEYSADLMGLRTKKRALTGTLMKCQQGIATITSSWGCFIAAMALNLPQTPVNAPSCLSKMIVGVFSSILRIYAVSNAHPRWRKWFVSLNGINALVTFRQPWHNCAINVTDSFAGSSWLVLNHNYITACTEDITCNSVQWHAFEKFAWWRKTLLHCMLLCNCAYGADNKGIIWHFWEDLLWVR